MNEQSPLDEYVTKAKKLIIDQGYISIPESGSVGNPTLPYPSSSKYILEYLYGNCKATSIYVPVEMWAQFKARCVGLGKNLSVVISHLIADWLGGKLRIKELETEKLDTSQLTKVSNSKPPKKLPNSTSLHYPLTCPATKQIQTPKLCKRCPSWWLRTGCIYPEKAEKKEKAYLRNHPMEAILGLNKKEAV